MFGGGGVTSLYNSVMVESTDVEDAAVLNSRVGSDTVVNGDAFDILGSGAVCTV